MKATGLGQHKWIVSFDINSLYPDIIIQYNISPEKIVNESSHGINVNKMIDMKVIIILKQRVRV